ncbi:hypothetical protein D9M71_646920 [compost metagenome]
MQQHWQVALGGQVIDARHRFVIGARRVATGQRREVIVAGKHFANPLPEPWVQFEHALDMTDGILVYRVEAGKKRMKAPSLFGGELFHGRRHVGIGGAVPIGIGVVTGVVTRPLGFVFMPFLGHRDTGNH